MLGRIDGAYKARLRRLLRLRWRWALLLRSTTETVNLRQLLRFMTQALVVEVGQLGVNFRLLRLLLLLLLGLHRLHLHRLTLLMEVDVLLGPASLTLLDHMVPGVLLALALFLAGGHHRIGDAGALRRTDIDWLVAHRLSRSDDSLQEVQANALAGLLALGRERSGVGARVDARHGRVTAELTALTVETTV